MGKFGQLFRLNLDSDILTKKIAEEFQTKPATKESSMNLTQQMRLNNSDKSKMNQFLIRDQITSIKVIGRLGQIMKAEQDINSLHQKVDDINTEFKWMLEVENREIEARDA